MKKKWHASVGPSAIVPFDYRELPAERHRRRLQEAVKLRARLETWLLSNGGALECTASLDKWTMTLPGMRAEWWPYNASLVLFQDSAHPIKAHDVHQVIEVLAEANNVLKRTREST